MFIILWVRNLRRVQCGMAHLCCIMPGPQRRWHRWVQLAGTAQLWSWFSLVKLHWFFSTLCLLALKCLQWLLCPHVCCLEWGAGTVRTICVSFSMWLVSVARLTLPAAWQSQALGCLTQRLAPPETNILRAVWLSFRHSRTSLPPQSIGHPSH